MDSLKVEVLPVLEVLLSPIAPEYVVLSRMELNGFVFSGSKSLDVWKSLTDPVVAVMSVTNSLINVTSAIMMLLTGAVLSQSEVLGVAVLIKND